jgi:hypothetical protein
MEREDGIRAGCAMLLGSRIGGGPVPELRIAIAHRDRSCAIDMRDPRSDDASEL